jgi:Zn finger protein HypA/HybF involved in hydrogenase expression
MVFLPDKPGMHCPGCQGQSVEIVSGRELYIDSLEVE